MGGSWAVSLSIGGMAADGTLTLTQEGETVTGELAIEGQTTDFEGTFSEGTLEMTGSSPDLGTITLEATVEGDDMTGSLGLGAMGSADFTGKRNPGTAASERRVER